MLSNLICSLWLMLVTILSVSFPVEVLGATVWPVGYDAQVQPRIAYDECLSALFAYDSSAEVSADECDNHAFEMGNGFAQFAEFLAAKTGADSALQGARLGEHLRQLEKYGQAGFKELESGRLRYYGNINPATTPGTMAGRRLVREWDPSTGAARTWHETVDQAGRVRIVRPETGGSKVHYMFDEHGNYTGSF